MLFMVITGGQTGADQAGWRAAKAFGIATGGWMPLGFLTELGPRPEFAELYGAVETASEDYRVRTAANVQEGDGTLWFGTIDSTGAKTTLRAADSMRRPRLVVKSGVRPPEVTEWIQSNRVKVLNVAGPRESMAPGIGVRVELFLGVVFRLIGHKRG